MRQYISRVLRSSCLSFVVTWFFQVRRLSKWSPRYLTVSTWSTTVWLMYTGGQCPRRRVNVMCDDLVSLIFSLHFRVQFSIVRRWSWRLAEAKVGSGWVVKLAVSSAKMLRIVVSDCGTSAVYTYIITDRRYFFGGHPRTLKMGVKFLCCMLSRSIYFVNMILGD
jgi:hypothetical protein